MRPVILERDGHACVACGRTERLTIHHVDHSPKHNEAHNLITLCSTCHMVHHKSNETPFPWLGRLVHARIARMTQQQIMKSIELEAMYSVHVYDFYDQK